MLQDHVFLYQIRHPIVLITVLLFNLAVSAQKKSLQPEDFSSWTTISGGGISYNGEFVFYQINNLPLDKHTLIVKPVKNDWQRAFVNATAPLFVENGRSLLVKLPGDTLGILNLDKNKLREIPAIRSYQLASTKDVTRIICNTTSRSLTIYDLNGNRLSEIHNTSQYLLWKDRGTLFTVHHSSIAGARDTMVRRNLLSGRSTIIYTGRSITNIVTDTACSQIAFLSRQELWHYKQGDSTATLLTGSKPGSLSIHEENELRFSGDGTHIFFTLSARPETGPNQRNGPQIWRYDGPLLKRNNDADNRNYLSVIDLKSGRLRQLINGSEKNLSEIGGYPPDNILFVQSQESKDLSYSYHIVHIKASERLTIETDMKTAITEFSISPAGKYFVYYDAAKENYVCYNITNHTKQIISSAISKFIFRDPHVSFNINAKYLAGIAGWLPDDTAILVHGTHDIWSLDPLNKRPPYQVTNGVGERENKVFFLAGEKLRGRIGKNGTLLLSAFDLKTKEYGYYKKNIGNTAGIEEIGMSSEYAGELSTVYTQTGPEDFIISGNGKVYMLRKEKTDQAPNYYISHDLRKFKAVSGNKPHGPYKWMVSELHTYTDSLGNEYQGVLYKPDPFYPDRSYPTVLYIYEQKSNELNHYQDDILPPGNCSIPLLVSNDYCVFLPDMHGQAQYSGAGALQSIIAATDHLDKVPGINNRKLALAGGSFGGFETNYIITRTNRFTAAISCAGVSNMISFATNLRGNVPGSSLRFLVDTPQFLIENSPVLEARNIRTPLLLMHNDQDNAISYLHSQDLFVILRALNRPVWWLNYQGEGHGLIKTENSLDYHHKVLDFLSCYLRDGPLPDWMEY